MEYANLMGVKYNSCPKCYLPVDRFGSLVDSGRRAAAVFQPKYESLNSPPEDESDRHEASEDWSETANQFSLQTWFITSVRIPHP
jgi:hypothetical protein